MANRVSSRFRLVITEMIHSTTSPDHRKHISSLPAAETFNSIPGPQSTPTFNNPQFRASFAGAFMSIVRSSDPNVHPPVKDVITPHWKSFNDGRTQMLFNMTESGQPVITPIASDPALLQRCEYVNYLEAQVFGVTHNHADFGRAWQLPSHSDLVTSMSHAQKPKRIRYKHCSEKMYS